MTLLEAIIDPVNHRFERSRIFLIILCILDEINFLLVLREDSSIFLVPRTVREHLEIVLHLDVLHVFQHSLVFHLSMFWAASNTSQVCNACLRALHDEDLRPEVLDERI